MGQEFAGKTIVLSGASSGIGEAAAKAFAEHDANLILLGRNTERLERVAEATGAIPIQVDNTSLRSVNSAALKIRDTTSKIDYLINNAGGTFNPRSVTQDGYDPNFQVNYLSNYLLTVLLKEPLSKSGGAVVVNTASMANLLAKVDINDIRGAKDGRIGEHTSYANSKLLTILFSREIPRRWSNYNVSSVALHPGVVATNFNSESRLFDLLYRSPARKLFKSPEKAARTILWVTSEGSAPLNRGIYYHEKWRNAPTHTLARNPEAASSLWEQSNALLAAYIE